MKEILENLKALGIDREFSISVETMDALKLIQRVAQAHLNRDISVNKIMNVAIIHYAKLLKEGKL